MAFCSSLAAGAWRSASVIAASYWPVPSAERREVHPGLGGAQVVRRRTARVKRS